MSDATKCAKCGWVYWTHSYENWGTCPKCDTNNDFHSGLGKPELVESKYIFTYYEDPLFKKAKEAVNDE